MSSVDVQIYTMFFNQFHASGLFLYLLQTSENL